MFLTIKVHHKIDTMLVSQDSLMNLLFLQMEINGRKQNTEIIEIEWTNIFEVDKTYLTQSSTAFKRTRKIETK